MKIAALIFLSVSVSFAAYIRQPKPQTTQPAKPSAVKSKPKASPRTATAKAKTATTSRTASATKTAASAPKLKAAPVPQPTPTPIDPAIEKERFDLAVASAAASEKINLLKAFIIDFPKSENLARARELLVVARSAAGDENLQAGQTDVGVSLFKEAVANAPKPYPDRLFDEVISKIPASLYFRGEPSAAFDIAAEIEREAAGNSRIILALANFYLSIENGSEAKRLANAALEIDPVSAAAHQTLGLADRLNFDLEDAAAAFAKALELDPESTAAKRNLAEMKRATGNPADAEVLYRELLARDSGDAAARTGIVLSLFDRGEKSAAEAELAAELEKNPNNVILLAGAALWYSVNDDAARAAELAGRAISLEPRYIWSHIALARARLRQNDPTGAERTLIVARRYGNFPTLEYELAAALMNAGFYREAAEGLSKAFVINGNKIETRLGGRISRESDNFVDLLAPESRASVFSAINPDSRDLSVRLRALLELNEYLTREKPLADVEEIVAAVDSFVAGSDKMKLHRQLYAASLLLERSVALDKVLELTANATGTTDTGLEAPNPTSAVMASELYESRAIALSKNEFVAVPDVPRQTLSAILRGRIEEIAGWALFRQGKYPESLIRLRRALTVLPEKSAWWRSAMWRIGTSFEANNKPEDALNAYIGAYRDDLPNPVRYVVIESLYRKLRGNILGLEDLIGPNPLPPTVAQLEKTSDLTAIPMDKRVTPADVGDESRPANPPTNEEKTVGIPAEPSPLENTPKIEPEKPSVEKNTEIPVALDKPVNAAIGKETEKPAEQTRETVETNAPPTPLPVEKPTIGESVGASNVVKPPESGQALSGNVIPSPASSERTILDAARPIFEPVIISVGKPQTAKPVEISEKKPTEPEKPAVTESEPATEQRSVKTADAANENPIPDKVEKTETPNPHSATDNAAAKVVKELIPNPPSSEPQAPAPTGIETAANSKNAEAETQTEDEKTTPKSNEINEIKDNKIGVNSDPKPADNEQAAKPSETVLAGIERSRIVPEKPGSDSIPPCSIFVSQENISIVNSGGGIGLLVGIDGGEIGSFRAVSTSPSDLELQTVPEIAGVAGRAFLMIRSISVKTGLFQVSLIAPCGRKDVTVRVR